MLGIPGKPSGILAGVIFFKGARISFFTNIPKAGVMRMAKKVRVRAWIPVKILDEIKALCRRYDITISEFMREAAIERLQKLKNEEGHRTRDATRG